MNARATKLKRSNMSDLGRDGLSDRGPLRAVARLFDSSFAITWRYWKFRLGIVLLWLFGIPLSAIGFFTMLFWAYGVSD